MAKTQNNQLKGKEKTNVFNPFRTDENTLKIAFLS